MASETDRAWLAAVFSFVLVADLFVAGGVLWTSELRAGHVFVDFFMIWSAARYVLEIGTGGFYDPEPLRAFQSILLGQPHGWHPFPYPPIFLFAVLPLGLLPYFCAYAVAMIASMAGLIGAAAGRRPSALFVAALLTSPAAVVNFLYGHNGFFSAALLAGGARLLRERPVAAGVLFGLLCYKPQLALAVPVALVAAGAWTTLASAVLTALLAALASLAVFGMRAWEDWLAFLPYFSKTVLAHGDEFFAKMSSLTPALLRIGMPFPATMAVQFLAAAVVLAVLWLAFRRGAHGPAAGALLLTAPFLVTPYAYSYDLPLVAVAVLWLGGQLLERGASAAERIALTLAWTAPLAAMFPLPPLLAPAVPLALGACFAVAARRCCAGAHPPADDMRRVAQAAAAATAGAEGCPAMARHLTETTP